MFKPAAISRSELVERRRRLRRQRRWRAAQSLWRFLLVVTATGGLIWVITLPGWIIYSPEQIAIDGNEFLPDEAVQSLLPIDYPESIIQIRPHGIERHLKARGPIAEVLINRQLFPPSLTITIQERRPVAMLIGGSYGSADSDTNSDGLRFNQATRRLAPTGLIDENGTLIPLENYTALDDSLELPDLRIIGMQEHYRPQWVSLYRQISQSPLEIFEIDWQDPANLILNTDLGIVYFGAYDATRFGKQLVVLDQMRSLPEQIDSDQIAYIDVSAPDNPLIQTVDRVY